MTVKNLGGQLSCVGYAAFRQRWGKDDEFRRWFKDFAYLPSSERKDGVMRRMVNLSNDLRNLEDALDPNKKYTANYSKWDPEKGKEML